MPNKSLGNHEFVVKVKNRDNKYSLKEDGYYWTGDNNLQDVQNIEIFFAFNQGLFCHAYDRYTTFIDYSSRKVLFIFYN